MQKFSRFDAIVIVALAALSAIAALLTWQTRRQGVRIISTHPVQNAEDVSTRQSIVVRFTETMEDSQAPLVIQPPVAGAALWKDSRLEFTPSEAFKAGTRYTVTLAENLKSLQGRPLQGERLWRFQTRNPAILYLAPDQDDSMQLTRLDPSDMRAQRLSQASSGILDYVLSPSGSTLIYAQKNSLDGSDLWLMNLATHDQSILLKCPEDICRHVVWSPDGKRLIYERKTPSDREFRLWWLDLKSTETIPAFENAEQVGYGAGWSTDSQWLSYLDPIQQELRLYNVEDGRQFGIPNQLGEPPAWHPDQNILLFTDILLKGEEKLTHLFQLDVETAELYDISGEMRFVEDRFPSWSSAGDLIAFIRQEAGELQGKRLVLMEATNREEPFMLSYPLSVNSQRPFWSPDDRRLLFQSFSLQNVSAPSKIWLLEVSNGRIRELVSSGRQPSWLP